MLSATAFSLLVPALDRGSLLTVLVGFGLGAATLRAMDSLIPHVHARFNERGHEDGSQHRALMLISALTIHNVPEGMAVGVAFAAGGSDLGIPIALAIGIQNIPEGFVAGAPLVGMTRRSIAIWIAALTGFVEPPAAFAAFFGLDLFAALLAGALAFAAGAMLYVIVDEIIPESHGRGNERDATLALLVGFMLMLVLDNAFG